MLELMICSMFTLLPDYLFRRYVQGKRFGKEITLFSVWFELRWGIVTCLLLAVSLITAVFYFHPATTNVLSVFRAVPIVSQIVVPLGVCAVIKEMGTLEPLHIWIAILIGHATRCTLSVVRFSQGKWRNIAVDMR